MTTYLLSVAEVFFNRQSAYLWEQTVLLSPTCSFFSYEADFIEGLLKKYEKKLARLFNFTFRYIDDFRSLNNYRFGDFFDPIELDIKDTTDTVRSDSYLELHSGDKLRTKLCVNIFPM